MMRHTTTVEEQSTLLAGWNQHYAQLSHGAFSGMLSETTVSGAYLFREVTTRSLLQSGIIDADVLAVGIPLAIKGPAQFCGSACGEHQLHVFSGRQGFEFHTPSDLDIIGIVIPRGTLFDQLDAAEVDQVAAHLATAHLLDIPPVLFQRLGQGLHDLMADAALLEDIAPLLAGALTTALTQRPPGRHTHLIGKLREIATDPNNDQPPNIQMTCQQLDVSRRTLQYVLQRELGISPAEYMRTLRLNSARTSILEGASVTQAATMSGFCHFGRFAQDYCTLFGELPSTTLYSQIQRP